MQTKKRFAFEQGAFCFFGYFNKGKQTVSAFVMLFPKRGHSALPCPHSQRLKAVSDYSSILSKLSRARKISEIHQMPASPTSV